MGSNAFDEVVGRLKVALDVETDLQVANTLGIKQSTWAMRRKRGDLPTEKIDALICAEEINAEYVYKGLGGPHLPVDDEQWKTALQRKLLQILEIQTYARSLEALGYKAKDLQRISDGKADLPVELLRDLRRALHVDLHAMLCDELPVTPEEKALVEKYRQSPLRGKRAIEAVADLASQPATET